MNRILSSTIPGADNFTYGELIKSDIAIRRNLDNTPTETQWKNLELLARKILQPVRNKFGAIKINSGFRSSIVNSINGGSPNSTHLFGMAADIEPYDNSITLYNIFEYIATTLNFHELIAEYFPSGWVHVAIKDDNNMKMIKLKDNNHSYTRVTLDYVKQLYG